MLLARSLCIDWGVVSVASCANGLPNCMEDAVLVVSDTFISRVEKMDTSFEKGEDSVLD